MIRAVICFTRVPKPGITKTRLLGLLSPEQCVRLHTAFLRDLAEVYIRLEADLYIAYTADPDWEMLCDIFPHAAGFFHQEGENLGEKMYHALSRVLALGYERAVLTGADLPLLTAAHLESGFAALEKADIVLGPTPDGGYYLIGMKSPHPQPFRVSGYGGATVYENTLAAIRAAALSAHPAMECADVDTPGDLRALLGLLNPNSATARCLAEFRKEGTAL